VAFCDLLGKVGGAAFEVDVARGQAARSAVPITFSVGQVVGIYIADDVIADGMIGVRKVNPLAHLGYLDYATIDNVLSMNRSACTQNLIAPNDWSSTADLV
jgi:hypothetical protein